MSGSYRLETPRARPGHLLMKLEDSSRSWTAASPFGSTPYLYDVPSPPTSPKSSQSLASPTSPTFAHSRSRGPSPSPGGRNRSTTPSRTTVVQSDLEQFTRHCRNWYFNQNAESGRAMTSTMASLSPSEMAPYSRLQAQIRSAYHRSVQVKKHAELRAIISSIHSGQSTSLHARSNPTAARLERHERFKRFVGSFCTQGNPGPQPFFTGLWALMRLIVLPEELGGGGGYRICWEIDDAVFKENGKEFLAASIDILKGVLAFEEVATTSKSSLAPNSDSLSFTQTLIHSRSQSQPLSSDKKPADHPKRARAPSDPFLDHFDSPGLSRSVGSNTSTLLTTTFEDELSSPGIDADIDDLMLDNCEEDYLRTWTSPADLSNPEILDLLNLFPSFITRKSIPRFSTVKDPEAAERVRCGTGEMWVSSQLRSEGWQGGGWWTRFIQWLRQLFC
ncbi:hypothetical protein C8J56DRAFT_926437 [Mycena floridula]|nr:hypothetical protein C8J56DRAFT_926437 [Mycena floridula]